MKIEQIVGRLYQQGVRLSVEGNDLVIDAPDEVLTDDVLGTLRRYKSDIVILLGTLESAQAVPRPVKGDHGASYEYPASLAQQRMLFMEDLAGLQSYYNVPVAYHITGPLDRPALCKAFDRLIQRHDVLRTIYRRTEHGYLQKVDAPSAMQVVAYDLSAESHHDDKLALLLRREAEHVFNLESQWPIRVALIALGPQEHVLSINVHHIAADGWSARAITEEISVGYLLALDHANDKENFPHQYADYVEWQHRWQQSLDYQQAKQYWVDALKGAPQLHSLPTDFVRPTMQSVHGKSYSHVLPFALCDSLRGLARVYQTTPFVILQAVFAAFLARYSEESDIVFGTAAANRQPAEFVDTIGLFVNTLVLRYAVEDDASFDALIHQAIKVSRGAFRHQQLPFDVLVDELQPARSLGYNPLVQIMLVMQENAAGSLRLEGARVEQLRQQQDVSKFDLAVHAYMNADCIRLEWEYSTSLFRTETITAMAMYFQRLLDVCADAPKQLVGDVPLVEENVTGHDLDESTFPVPKCIHRLIEAHAAHCPDAIAVRDGGLDVTYRELNELADRVASALHQAGVGKGKRVGVCMEKSVDLVSGMLAAFKLGATYVPLDPHYPKQRLEFMLQDSGVAVVLLSSTALPDGLHTSVPVMLVDDLLGKNLQATQNYPAADDVDAPAYIIYTSGSTGAPKGVLVPHKSLFHSLHANATLMGIGPDDVMPTIGSQAFGVSLLEILLPLTSGGTVMIVKKNDVVDLSRLIELTDKATVVHAVPSLMRQWLDALQDESKSRYQNLRLLLVGGEAVPDGLLKRVKSWRPHVRLLELYGMTESTVVCSSYEAGEDTSSHYCIGKPHAHMRFYVLSRRGQRQPVGVPGELYIGGLALANEYINQPEMTSERFIAHPLAFGKPLYRTGDRVRLLADGNIEFLGRVDHQVSLRGARIELSEIETLAAEVDGVKQAVAHVADLGQEEKTLVLFYTSLHEASQADLANSIRQHLAHRLPDYMRPSIVQLLETFPLNPNGKVDRKRLPKPEIIENVVDAETDLERRVAELWCSVLQRDVVSVTSNFFEIGGHSLMAAKLVTRIRSNFGVEFPLSAVFDVPTVRLCAIRIEEALKEKYAKSLIQQDSHAGETDCEEMVF
jgi:amino acid adenylation domain-containing protein